MKNRISQISISCPRFENAPYALPRRSWHRPPRKRRTLKTSFLQVSNCIPSVRNVHSPEKAGTDLPEDGAPLKRRFGKFQIIFQASETSSFPSRSCRRPLRRRRAPKILCWDVSNCFPSVRQIPTRPQKLAQRGAESWAY